MPDDFLPPEKTIDIEVEWNGKTYKELALREPTAAEVITALNKSGNGADSNHQLMLSLICSVTGYPRQIVEKVPIHTFNAAGRYLLDFLSVNLPTGES